MSENLFIWHALETVSNKDLSEPVALFSIAGTLSAEYISCVSKLFSVRCVSDTTCANSSEHITLTRNNDVGAPAGRCRKYIPCLEEQITL